MPLVGMDSRETKDCLVEGSQPVRKPTRINEEGLLNKLIAESESAVIGGLTWNRVTMFQYGVVFHGGKYNDKIRNFKRSVNIFITHFTDKKFIRGEKRIFGWSFDFGRFSTYPVTFESVLCATLCIPDHI